MTEPIDITAAIQESKTWAVQRGKLRGIITQALDELKASRAEVERLRGDVTKLVSHALHYGDCPRPIRDEKCTCGLDKWIKD